MSFLLDGLTTGRLQFRKIQPSDSNIWIEFFKNPETHKHWSETRGTPAEETEKWYAKQFSRYENNQGGMNALIEKASNKLIGHCGLLVQTVDTIEELEVGYSILPEYWNKGYATEAARKCRDYAFENGLSDSLISIISVTNTASLNVARKNGMHPDRETIYKNNPVVIYRIRKAVWELLNSAHEKTS